VPRRQLTMRVPLPLAALAPVEHGAYAREVGRQGGEVDQSMVGRASLDAPRRHSLKRYLQSLKNAIPLGERTATAAIFPERDPKRI
jgi:hypothetical protein